LAPFLTLFLEAFKVVRVLTVCRCTSMPLECQNLVVVSLEILFELFLDARFCDTCAAMGFCVCQATCGQQQKLFGYVQGLVIVCGVPGKSVLQQSHFLFDRSTRIAYGGNERTEDRLHVFLVKQAAAAVQHHTVVLDVGSAVTKGGLAGQEGASDELLCRTLVSARSTRHYLSIHYKSEIPRR
jgi:hypothetical protein